METDSSKNSRRTQLLKFFSSFVVGLGLMFGTPNIKKLGIIGLEPVLALDKDKASFNDSEDSLETLKKELITVLEEIGEVENELQSLKETLDELIQKMLTTELFQAYNESDDEDYYYVRKHMNSYVKGLQNELVVLMEKLATLKAKEQNLTERINSHSANND